MGARLNRWLDVSVGLLLGLLAATASAADTAAGAALYTQGVLPDGRLLEGRRPDGSISRGAEAACISCHQRSGLGNVEGQIFVPPVTGRALFGEGAPVVVRVSKRLNASLSSPHSGYSEAEFATLLRDGVTPDGRRLLPLMPRFDLGPAALQALTAYLHTLSAQPSPGIDANTVHLASVVTPDTAPDKAAAFVLGLQTLVMQHNLLVNSGLRQKIPAAERRLQSRRRWDLKIWQLTGPASDWGAQLLALQRAQPVFALLSGYGRHAWQPVQDFCEAQQVVCWLPSILQAPPNAAPARFALYFSNGLALQAGAISQHRQTRGPVAPDSRVLLIHAPDSPVEAIQNGLLPSGTASSFQSVEWNERATAAIDQALLALQPQDVLIVDLSGPALQRLLQRPSSLAPVYFLASARDEQDRIVQSAWKKQAFLVDPLERPALRDDNLASFKAWAASRQVPVADLLAQSEAYVATQLLSACLADMLNNLHTGYLVERAEQTLSMREDERVQMEIQGQMMGGGTRQPAPQAKASTPVPPSLSSLLDRRGISAYPKLSLGPGQRFASKGAYVIDLNAAPADPHHAVWFTP